MRSCSSYTDWAASEKCCSLDFVHEPLDTSENIIRVVGIRRRRSNCGVIQTSLRTIKVRPSRQQTEFYTAISYTWGPEEPKRQILVNRHCLSVRPNLYKLLANLSDFQTQNANRTPMESLWIDAVCTYSDRTAIKYLGNLRFIPQYSEGFHFVSERNNDTPCFHTPSRSADASSASSIITNLAVIPSHSLAAPRRVARE
jgi:hypothetical protein